MLDCRRHEKKRNAFKMLKLNYDDWSQLTSLTDSKMKMLAAHYVIAVLIHASKDFVLYEKGIYREGCTKNVNHGVNIVGYGSKHWIVRNRYYTGTCIL